MRWRTTFNTFDGKNNERKPTSRATGKHHFRRSTHPPPPAPPQPTATNVLIHEALAACEPLSLAELVTATGRKEPAVRGVVQREVDAGRLVRRKIVNFDGRVKYHIARTADVFHEEPAATAHQHLVERIGAGYMPMPARYHGPTNALREACQVADSRPHSTEGWMQSISVTMKRHAYFPIDEFADPDIGPDFLFWWEPPLT